MICCLLYWHSLQLTTYSIRTWRAWVGTAVIPGRTACGCATPEHSDAEIITLAERLYRQQIRYAYFHVRYLDANGRLHFRYPMQAHQLTNVLHRYAPDVKLLAWVFVGGEPLRPHVALTNPAIRASAVREAAWLVDDRRE